MNNIYKYELWRIAVKLELYARWMKEALDESNVDFGNWELEEFEAIAKCLKQRGYEMLDYVEDYRELMSDK